MEIVLALVRPAAGSVRPFGTESDRRVTCGQDRPRSIHIDADKPRRLYRQAVGFGVVPAVGHERHRSDRWVDTLTLPANWLCRSRLARAKAQPPTQDDGLAVKAMRPPIVSSDMRDSTLPGW